MACAMLSVLPMPRVGRCRPDCPIALPEGYGRAAAWRTKSRPLWPVSVPQTRPTW